MASFLTAFAQNGWAVELVGGVIIIPGHANVVSGTPQEFTFWACPHGANGNIDLGPDGVTGTDDDLCQQVVASRSVQGGISTLSDPVGTSATLTPVDLQSGDTVSGAVVVKHSLGRGRNHEVVKVVTEIKEFDLR